MAKITASVVINRPIEEVFAFVSDFENDTQWWLGVTESRLISGSKKEVGAKYWQLSSFLGKRNETVFEITEYMPVHHLALQSITSALPFIARYTLETTAEGTRFTLNAEVEWKGFFKLIQPLTNFLLQRFSDKFFTKLKEVMESPDYKSTGLQKDLSGDN